MMGIKIPFMPYEITFGDDKEWPVFEFSSPSEHYVEPSAQLDCGRTQVRTIDEIKLGQIYKKRSIQYPKAITYIYILKIDTRQHKMHVVKINNKRVEYEYFADCGVIPYESGLWNTANWLGKLSLFEKIRYRAIRKAIRNNEGKTKE